MLEFQTVSREFRSLVRRRQELYTFLGSTFAALGIFLQNALHNNLPESLDSIKKHVFAFYALVLLVPTLALALRMGRIHAGMIINGILYARLMQEQDFTKKGDPRKAAGHNWLGVSFLYFLLSDLIAGFAATLLGLALALPLAPAMAVGAVVFAVWMVLYLWFHHGAARFALAKAAAETCAPFTKKEWEEHISGSLEDANHGLIADLGFVGLMVFSVFESLSGLGGINASSTDLTADQVKQYGPLVYSVLLLLTCVMGLMIYVRVRVAIGRFCLLLDPTDRPFRPLHLTDSLLGYIIEAFLLAVSLHVTLTVAWPSLGERLGLLLAIDGAVFAIAVLAEQVTLVVAGRRR